MNIIISPHVDDEIIGCYSLIKKGLIDGVVYLDATPERLVFARVACEELGFAICQLDFNLLRSLLQCRHADYCHPDVGLAYNLLEIGRSEPTFLVPDVSDNHLLHKFTNCVARLSGCKLGYYSVDMAASFIKELSKPDQEEKRAMLNKYYPDQSSLWENNWKYFLFEGVVYDFNTTTITM